MTNTSSNAPLTAKEIVASTSPSIRNQLLQNIQLQTQLTAQLFAVIARSSSTAPSNHNPSPSSNAPPTISSLFSLLEDASEEQAQLLEIARVHQHKYRLIEEKRRHVRAVENRIKEVVWGLNQSVLELEVVVREGKEVVASIDKSEAVPVSPSTLLSYASHLAPLTSRGPTWPPTFNKTSEGNLYPTSETIRKGRLGKGQSMLDTAGEDTGTGVAGIAGHLGGYGDMITIDAPDVKGITPAVAPTSTAAGAVEAREGIQQDQRADVGQAAQVSQPAADGNKPFKLGFDSDDDSEDE